MKIKPADKKKRGVLLELGPRETQLRDEAARPAFNPLALFKINRILVPVDFSDCSRKAIEYALPFARAFDATIVLLHVVEAFLPTPEMTGVDVGLIQRQLREGGERRLAELRKELGGVPVESVLRIGRTATEILRAARELDSDLILLSTHGRTGLAHVFLGSTAEQVIRHAGCPVLVVREKEHEFIRDSKPETEARKERSKV
jgi:nucleotide-binding universal stress UspA family protein